MKFWMRFRTAKLRQDFLFSWESRKLWDTWFPGEGDAYVESMCIGFKSTRLDY
jgi:hypothetical protein